MAVKLLPDVEAGVGLQALMEVDSQASTLGPGTAADAYMAYMRWTSEAVRRLRHAVHPHELDRLVLTRRHWALCGVDEPGRTSVREVVNVEVDELRRCLREAVEELQSRVRRWANVQHFVVADTGLYLEHRDGFESIPWPSLIGANPVEQVCLIVPMPVVDELDAAKRAGEGWKRGRAGYSLNRLRQAIGRPGTPAPLVVQTPAAEALPLPGSQGVLVDLLIEAPDHVRLPSNDEEIIDQALGLTFLASAQVHLLTFDHGMDFRARAKLGIQTWLLNEDVKSDEARKRPDESRRAQRRLKTDQPPGRTVDLGVAVTPSSSSSDLGQ